tara:strand:+ start:1837 stop:2439 length:603 start_codon:yes stop_codon:yes gene_type:complete
MNRYYKKLNFPSELIPDIDTSQWDTEGYSWIQFHKVLKPHQLKNDKFIECLKSLGMCSRWIEVFYTPPGQDGVIHSDNTDWLDWTKIYFQYGAVGSTMRWWESDKTVEYSTATGKYIKNCRDRTEEHYHGQVLVAQEEDSTIVYEADLKSPCLVNVGKLHSSHNPTKEKRFALTVALSDIDGGRILWDDALSRLSDYYDK